MTTFPSARLPKKAKVTFIGDEKTGKTSIISKYLYDSFNSEYDPTVGADFSLKTVFLSDTCSVKLQLWDLAGQDIFKSHQAHSYIAQSDVIVLVYDLTHGNFAEKLMPWIEKISTLRNEVEILRLVLVGNKSDIETVHKKDKKIVTEEEIRKQLIRHPDPHLKSESDDVLLPNGFKKSVVSPEILFFETSAKTGSNVALLFESIAGLVYNEDEENYPDLNEMVLDFNAPPSNQWCKSCSIM